MTNPYRIYCYTNQITGQKYIGNTKLSQYERSGKDGHKYVKNCSIFGSAIIEYGWNNFVYSVLEDNLTKEQSEIRERFWIEKLGTTFPKGYNLQSGGWQDRKLHDETKKKLSEIMIGKNAGSNNPMYGKPAICRGMHWFNNGTINIRTFECPKGYVSGRLKKASV